MEIFAWKKIISLIKKLQNFYILFVNLGLDLKSISNDQEKANLPKQTQELKKNQEQTPNNF